MKTSIRIIISILAFFAGGLCPGKSIAAPPATATLYATLTSIAPGQQSTLVWSSTNATSCSGTASTWGVTTAPLALGTSGSLAMSPTATTVYVVVCTGSGGASPAADAMVMVVPAVVQPLPANVRYWFAPLPYPAMPPGSRGSVDYMGLFTQTAPWQTAAAHIQVFKLYQWEFLPQFATDAQIAQVVTNLQQRGIALAIEGGALPTSGTSCGMGVEGFSGPGTWTNLFNRVKAAGGTIAYIAMDEPYAFGHFYTGPYACNWTVDQVAQQVAAFITMARAAFPHVIVGDIEQMQIGDSTVFQMWFTAVKNATGAALPFLHLDVNWGVATWLQQAKSIELTSRANGVPFGIIYGGDVQTTDSAWIQAAESHAQAYESFGGLPDNVIFQSWDAMPDHVLPETTAYTFTNFVDEYFTTYTGAH